MDFTGRGNAMKFATRCAVFEAGGAQLFHATQNTIFFART